jgi:hypothetical protein
MPNVVSLDRTWLWIAHETRLLTDSNLFPGNTQLKLESQLKSLQSTLAQFPDGDFAPDSVQRSLKILKHDLPNLSTLLSSNSFDAKLLELHKRLQPCAASIEASLEVQFSLSLLFTQLCGSLMSCHQLLHADPRTADTFSFCVSDLSFCYGAVTSAASVIIHQNRFNLQAVSLLKDLTDISELLGLMTRFATLQQTIAMFSLQLSRSLIKARRAGH